MTPEEKAVIEAARRFTNGLPSGHHGQAVINAVKRLEEAEHKARAIREADRVAYRNDTGRPIYIQLPGEFAKVLLPGDTLTYFKL